MGLTESVIGQSEVLTSFKKGLFKRRVNEKAWSNSYSVKGNTCVNNILNDISNTISALETNRHIKSIYVRLSNVVPQIDDQYL